MGKYGQAEKIYLKSLLIRKKLLGDNHPDTVSNYYNLATLYSDIKNWEKAFVFLSKTIKIWEQTLPINHVNLINAKKNIKIISENILIKDFNSYIIKKIKNGVNIDLDKDEDLIKFFDKFIKESNSKHS